MLAFHYPSSASHQFFLRFPLLCFFFLLYSLNFIVLFPLLLPYPYHLQFVVTPLTNTISTHLTERTVKEQFIFKRAPITAATLAALFHTASVPLSIVFTKPLSPFRGLSFMSTVTNDTPRTSNQCADFTSFFRFTLSFRNL